MVGVLQVGREQFALSGAELTLDRCSASGANWNLVARMSRGGESIRLDLGGGTDAVISRARMLIESPHALTGAALDLEEWDESPNAAYLIDGRRGGIGWLDETILRVVAVTDAGVEISLTSDAFVFYPEGATGHQVPLVLELKVVARLVGLFPAP